jgi:anti-sigma factor RsiW
MTPTHYTSADLVDYLHGACSPERDAAIFAHLAVCGACREERDIELALTVALRADPLFAERELPAMIRARVWEAVRAERPSFAARLTAFVKPAYALPTAAAIVIAAYFGIPAATSTYSASHAQPPGWSATALLDEHAAEVQNPLSDHAGSFAGFGARSAQSASIPLVDSADAAMLPDADVADD